MSKPVKKHASRVSNYRMLLDAMGDSKLTRDEISELLNFSASGARKYIKEMIDSGAFVFVERLESNRKGVKGQGVYAPGTPEAIRAFMELSDVSPVSRARAKKAAQILAVDPTRHIHLMQDDCTYPMHPDTTRPHADPLALPTDFFRPSMEFVERRLEVRTPVPQPTGFAALEFAHFERRPA